MDTDTSALLGRSAPALIGRSRSLAELDGLLTAVLAGRGRAVVVLGEPGMGKTTLVEALADRAAAVGVPAAWGWCSSAEVPPFWPWRTLLRDVAPQHPIAADHAFSDPGTIGILRGDAGARQTLFVSVVDALREAALERPAVLIVEDVQWADAASLHVLRTLVDALPAMPVLLVMTCRDDPLEVDESAREFVRSLPTGVDRIRLGGLGRDEVAQLVTRILGVRATPDVATAIHARTGGNPFFVREVARLLVAQPASATTAVPEGVREVLERRIARLSNDCQRVLEITAVAGEGGEVSLVAAVAGTSEADVVARLDEAVHGRLLAGPPSDGRVRFAHALVREVLEASLGGVRRAALHRALAEHLERVAPDPEAVSGELARHWSLALGDNAGQAAAAWSLKAARAAKARMGYEQAVGAYRVALRGQGVDRIGVLIELGEAQMYAGDLDGARETFGEAAELARDAGRAEDLAQAVLGLGTGMSGFEVRLYDEHQIGLLEEALRLLPAGDGVLRAAVLGRLSVACAQAGREEQRLGLASEAVEMARRLGDPCVEASTLAAYCDAVAGPDHADERLAAASRMLALTEGTRDLPCQLLARRLRVVALMERGDWPSVDDEIAAYARTSARLMLPLYAWCVPIWHGARALMCGDVASAHRFADAAEVIGHRAGSVNADLMVFSLRLWCYRAQGRHTQFLSELGALLRQFYDNPTALGMAAGYLAAGGEMDEARTLFDRLVSKGLDAVAFDCEWLESMWCVGDAALALGRYDVAEEVARRLRPYAQLWAIDGIGGAVIGVTAHILGRLEAALGRPDEGARLLSAATERYRTCGAGRLLAEARAALAELEELPAVTAPATQPAAGASALVGELRRDGRIWSVRWRDHVATVPDSKGMRDLAVLLGRPNTPVHVLDLVEAAGGPPRAAAGADTGPVLDATARSAYRQRLTDLAQDIAEAELDGDQGRAAKLRDEQDFIAAELTAAYGMGGRVRTTGDPAERARKAVSMRIATALRAIREVHPTLARHLDLTVATGRFCVYRPEEPVDWR